ncbi:hypothetical protein HPB52_016065 [Rhipicephalus sanguineus]|uniref:Uncharacterized protein n=1 Tax=Rhipicephalus sanguineus TaxID=34632 RepID=A0A9D4YQG4_RHISA|nr:hypothetical protein HPB52_016065 [Rhipicephalus sanguineus]
MVKKQADDNHGPPKAGRVKYQAAADGNAAGLSNEAPAAKRPRGRPSKGVAMEQLAPKPIARTAARKLRKAADAAQPECENPFTIIIVDTCVELEAVEARPTVGKKPREKEEAQQEPPTCPVQKLFLGYESFEDGKPVLYVAEPDLLKLILVKDAGLTQRK